MMQNNTPDPLKQNVDLPIIHRLMEVYKIWQEYLQDFSRISRFTLGEKIDIIFLELTEDIFSASALKSEKKLSRLNESSVKLDLLKFLLRIAWEIKAIDNKKFILLSDRFGEIGKMLGGWIRQLKEKLPLETEEQR